LNEQPGFCPARGTGKYQPKIIAAIGICRGGPNGDVG
jgi:hypothetical protein